MSLRNNGGEWLKSRGSDTPPCRSTNRWLTFLSLHLYSSRHCSTQHQIASSEDPFQEDSNDESGCLLYLDLLFHGCSSWWIVLGHGGGDRNWFWLASRSRFAGWKVSSLYHRKSIGLGDCGGEWWDVQRWESLSRGLMDRECDDHCRNGFLGSVAACCCCSPCTAMVRA